MNVYQVMIRQRSNGELIEQYFFSSKKRAVEKKEKLREGWNEDFEIEFIPCPLTIR